MSQKNVEIVREAFQALSAGGIEAALSFFTTDCVWYPTDRWLDGSAYRGRDGMRGLVAAFTENFDDWAYEVHSLRGAGDRVVALSKMTGQIKHSGSSISQSIGLVVSDFHGGSFGEVRAFPSWDAALKAVGLAE